MTAKRNNSGKVELSKVPTVALYEEAKVYMYGAEKYENGGVPLGQENWRKLWGDQTYKVCLDSALRHLTCLANNELFDDESGLAHAAHVRANMAFILEHMRNEQLIQPTVYKSKVSEEATEKRNITCLVGSKL